MWPEVSAESVLQEGAQHCKLTGAFVRLCRFVVRKKKVKICSSPDEPWVRKAMKYVDSRERRRLRGKQEVPRKKQPTSAEKSAPY